MNDTFLSRVADMVLFFATVGGLLAFAVAIGAILYQAGRFFEAEGRAKGGPS